MLLWEWRGRLCLRLARVLDRWSWALTTQARRDLGCAVRPDNDLFNGK